MNAKINTELNLFVSFQTCRLLDFVCGGGTNNKSVASMNLSAGRSGSP